MHVVFFGDQHLESLGGAQVSMRLQLRFLEKAGHTVTVVAPRMHGPRAAEFAERVRSGTADPAGPDGADAVRARAYVDTPSIAITPDREYSFTWPGAATDRAIDRALASRPAVDLVHVQADFWGAMMGHRYAHRHGLPVVHTMHNRVDVGIQATAPFPGLVLRVLNIWQRRMLRADPAPVRGHDGWAFLRGYAARAHAVTAPSAHFAGRLDDRDVVPGRGRAGSRVDVVWNGIDDDVLAAALAARTDRIPGPPRLVWLGRMSPEKRLLPFLEALADSRVHADVEVLGGGAQRRAAQRLVERLRPVASVTFGGRLSYAETLRRMAAADAVVQTSIGFETQGMTVFEAASLGTPSIVSDPDIGRELASGFWQVPDASTAALADTLRRACADIAEGAAPPVNPEVGERFRQSSRTAAMLEVYARALGR